MNNNTKYEVFMDLLKDWQININHLEYIAGNSNYDSVNLEREKWEDKYKKALDESVLDVGKVYKNK